MEKTRDEDWVTTRAVVDEDGDRLTVVREQDVEAILDHNKALQNDGSNGYGATRDMRKVASIPLVVVEQWIKEDGVNLLHLSGPEKNAYLRKKLNDPDNRFFKTIDGRWN